MSDILVFSPPAPDNMGGSGIGRGLAEISGWLVEEGYGFDQKSLLAEVRFLNRFRFQEDVVDLSVFEPERIINYLEGSSDQEIKREANKLADRLSIEEYSTIIVPTPSEFIISRRDFRLMMALPILKERIQDEQTVIIGGVDLTENMEVASFPFVDYVVDGDMEIPLSNILEHEFEGEELDTDPGVVCKKDGQLVRGEPYEHPMKMKAKPYFDKNLLDKHAKTSALNSVIIPYQLGRGCSQDCSFCNLFEDQSYQYKNVDKVVEELKQLKEETGADKFWFTDRNLFNNPDYLKKLALRMIDQDLDIKWGGLSIVVPRAQEFFDILAESGCKALQHGIESASNSVLHRMQKHQTRKMIEETIEKENKAGIKIYGLFLTDYVDETWDEYFETVDFIKNTRWMTGGRVASLMIFPDEKQPLYRNSDEYGIEFEESEEKSWMKRSLNFSVSFTDSRDEDLSSKEARQELKETHMQKLMDWQLFVKNFGREHPITFLKLQASKIFYKDYSDKSHYFV